MGTSSFSLASNERDLALKRQLISPSFQLKRLHTFEGCQLMICFTLRSFVIIIRFILKMFNCSFLQRASQIRSMPFTGDSSDSSDGEEYLEGSGSTARPGFQTSLAYILKAKKVCGIAFSVKKNCGKSA